MDDDIDIEEHDLLDNPKIKSIFPDLSRVKIEIPDDDEIEVPDYDEETDQPTDCEPSLNYSYQYSFETEVEQLPMTGEYDEYDSKGNYINVHDDMNPPIDEEILYQEALNSKPFVYLENWENRLKSSPCYCAHCNILFSTVNALDAHKMISHSFLIAVDVSPKNTARKSTVTSKYCNHCSKTFPDDTSLIKHLYELLPLNNYPPKVESSEEADAKYKCIKCKKVFNSYNAGKRHKKIFHPTYNYVQLIFKMDRIRKSKKLMPEVEKLTPKVEKLTPKVEKLTPKVEKLTPKVEKLIPKVEKLTPKVEKLTPEVKKLKSKVDKLKTSKFDSEDSVSADGKIKSRKKRVGKFFASSSIFPKSTLFQCNLCQVAFLSCFAAHAHAKLCRSSVSNSSYTVASSKCNICKRKIRDKDKSIHNLQHSVNDKLKFYTINKNMYEKVLCRCPKCLVCFDELYFWTHCKNCDNVASVYCSDCDVNIAQIRYDTHKMKHVAKKYTKKDFIIVDFHDKSLKKNQISKSTNKKLNKKHVSSLKITQKKRVSSKISQKNKRPGFRRCIEDITLYYCDVCGRCQYKLNHKGHGTGVCDQKQRQDFFYCEECGLCFTRKSIIRHQILHTQRNFGLKDIRICNLSTGQIIPPPRPKMFVCRKKYCSANFLNSKAIDWHDCKEKIIKCKICNKKFNQLAYNVHKHFHSLDSLGQHSKDIQFDGEPQMDDIPELIKMYNSINNMWNILYKCTICELISKTYDSTVEHSQNHLNGIENDSHEKCYKCDFKIADNDFGDHMTLHCNNEDIDVNSFRILSYNYEDLFKRCWLNLFGGLPELHKEQILSKSIYRYTRIVKMRLEINAHTDDTNYFCMKCKIFLDGEDVQQHVLDNCDMDPNVSCPHCEEVFQTVKQLFTHDCPIGDIKHTSLVVFNDDTDKVFNKLLYLKSKNVVDNVVKKDKPVKNSRTIERSGDSGKKYKIFKCSNCSCCVFLKNNIKRHTCIDESRQKFCNICKQYYSKSYMARHLSMFHEQWPKVNYRNLSVVLFNNTDNNETYKKKGKHDRSVNAKSAKKIALNVSEKNEKKVALPVSGKIDKEDIQVTVKNEKKSPTVSQKASKSAKIYKCECGLHFTSIKTTLAHLDVCSPELEVSKETCSKCQLIFPTELLVTHLCNHHSQTMKIVIENVKRVYLLKCMKCLLLFRNDDFFSDHMSDCDPKAGKKCGGCNLNFHKSCYNKHLCSYKDKITYINKISVVKDAKRVYSVYRCLKCNISYTNHKSYAYHVEVNHQSKMVLIECEYCGLRFTKMSFVKHTKLHKTSEPEYRFKVIDPETGNFELLHGDNPVKTPKKERNDISDVVKNRPRKKLSMNDDDSLDTSKKLNITEQDVELDKSILKIKLEIEKDDKNKVIIDKSPVSLENNMTTIYKCTKCDVCYTYHKSYSYHKGVNHQIKRNIITCQYCKLKFALYSYRNHVKMHKGFKPRFKIKVIDAESNEFVMIEGSNVLDVKEEENMDVTEENITLDTDLDDSVKKIDKECNEKEDNFDANDSILKRRLEGSYVDTDNTIAKRPRRSVTYLKSSKYADFESNTTKDEDVFDDDVSQTDVSQDSYDSSFQKPNSVDFLSKKVKDKVLVNTYSKNLYKCSRCNQHFMKNSSFVYHINSRHELMDTYKCDVCDLEFSRYTLPRHVYVHHEKMGLKKEDFVIITKNGFSRKRSKKRRIKKHTSKEGVDNLSNEITENSSENSNKIAETVSGVTETKCAVKSEVTESVSEVNSNKFLYFKCADCNVCFLNAKACLDHTFKHEILDPKVYIHCKICEFQFMIDCLKEHMELHHSNDFKIENLTIEEYKPLGQGVTPKIDIYEALDKLQSRTVSTTTDVLV